MSEPSRMTVPAGSQPSPESVTTSPPAKASRTVIWFWVSVPVLSEQMTVVLPSVSTAGRLRMMEWRFAILPTPMARVMVTAAGRPSGIAPTASATAAMNMSTSSSPRSTPTRNVSAARPRIAYNSTWLNWAIRRVNGVASFSVDEMSSEMRPISVLSPMATTMPVPRP